MRHIKQGNTMLNIFSLGYVSWKKADEDLQGGLTASYTRYTDAIETWENYHQGNLVTSFGIPLQDYLYDAQTNFEVWANRNDVDINAVNFWIFATGQHITEALDRLQIDTATIPRWNDYINVMTSHVNSALDTHDIRTKQNLLSVLKGTLKKTKEDIKDKAQILNPKESILPFVLLGVAFLWLTK
jgi:TolB-like protein